MDQKTVINRDDNTYLYVKGRFTPIISEEVWDKCKAIRESRMALRKTREGKLEKTGVRTSEDIWAKRLVCRCGYRMRKDIGFEVFKSIAIEELDFSKPIKQSNLVDAIVKKIVPNTAQDYKWYLNLFPREEGVEENDYEKIVVIEIDYDTAKEFRA